MLKSSVETTALTSSLSRVVVVACWAVWQELLVFDVGGELRECDFCDVDSDQGQAQPWLERFHWKPLE